MSLRSRLVLTAGYLLVVVVIALVVPLGLSIQRRAVSEVEAGALGSAGILSARLSDLVVAPTSPGARGAMRRVVSEAAEGVGRVVVVDASGAILEDSAGLAVRGTAYGTSRRPEFSVALEAAEIDTRRRVSKSLDEELLLVTVPVVDRGQVVGAVRLSHEMGDVDAEVRGSWVGLGLLGVGVVAVGVGLAWLLATTLVRPVRTLESAATRLGRGDLDARAPIEGPAEVASLASSFNRTADALASNIVAQRDFLANASHQLRTPLTGIKLRLEAIREEGGFAARQAAKVEAEVDRLNELVDDLLQLARAASAESTGHDVDLASAARAAVDRWRSQAEAAGQSIAVAADGVPLAWADPVSVAHVLDNLIENAIRYCPPGSQVVVTAAETNGRPAVIVSDNGPGIPNDERARIFERFYRGSTGRAAGSGSGLGLPIVAETIRRWGGDIRLLDGPGTTIEAAFERPPTVS
ncbi:MAG: ATP-binding protein [Actinomycetota bacterium]